MSKPAKVALIAMGCEKNVVNSEQMLWLLDRAGFEMVGDPAEADVTVINTCAFIESARREALEQIAEVMETDSKIVLAGCLAEYHKKMPLKDLPEIDGYIGAGRFDSAADAVRDVLEGRNPCYFGELDAPVSETPRIYTGPPHTACLKIAEGCDNRCSYCAIPSLRGPYRSRRMEAVLDEARALAGRGVTELIVIAQDTTRYGIDLYGGPRLPELLEGLCKIDGPRRLRLHYLYPGLITEQLMDTVAAQPKIARYLDIPMQHASDRILRAMNRRYTRADLERLIQTLRDRIPGVVLRTSLIVGFPGETQADYEELLDFLQNAQIPRTGIFTYSREAGTAAAALPEQVPERTKRHRQKSIEKLQSRVADAFNRGREGSIADVLTEGYDRYAGVYYGRSEAESPDVDGVVFFTSEQPVPAGEWVRVLLDGAFGGDGKGAVIP
ncbi:MAG: 30S ribosomal protein S12 methylthiotransferase RimO [Oscillospiraceae bacterium]|jgi:ribosomal protein S12 methylthiotransferase|nr:30S ribosomal protein S12 methylthiotransferase RimO [Oscillospiraceae bacterium]